MSYVTEKTVWLSDEKALSPAVRKLLARMYELADDKGEEVGQIMATELFTPDATVCGGGPGHEEIKGTAAIAESRKQSWAVMSQRKHTILRAFGSTDGREIILIGQVDTTLINDKQLSVPWTAHMEVVGPDTDSPQVSFMRVYMDPSPVIAALKPAEQ
ncbi:hypothetical protein SBRCBS47491_010010 [Sporothrix bragantina]|uniref:SnoaL-like domain-containing protein n=1 Tax=Sporothrix bragantina TaxID=671064 RepID=A0ABP0D020_9PEZI